jgi:hypothetical protein
VFIIKEISMKQQSQHRRTLLLVPAVLVFILACTVSTSSGPTETQPNFAATQAALDLQSTAMALQMTQVALNSQQESQQPTQPPPPPATLPPLQPTPVPPTPTEDLQAKMNEAKILVYENTDEYGIGMWVQDALDELGLNYTQTGSYSGTFMQNLNSGIDWDLIIVDAEAKDRIKGEFWDVINDRVVRKKTAVIVELWDLDLQSGGRLGNFLSSCGVRFRKDYPLADSIYWWQPEHPIFNDPNVVLPLLHYSRYWGNQTGDQIMLTAGSQATMLAGLSVRKGDEGVLAVCHEGRVIVQTFSDHDYHRSDIVPLWKNYITNTLKNHFLATD